MPIANLDSRNNRNESMDKFCDYARATGNPTKRWGDEDDDDDDMTVLSGGGEKIDQKLMEFNVKWSFTKLADEKAVRNALVELLTLIIQLQSDTTTLIDHNGQEFAMNQSMNEEKHIEWIKKEFKIPIYKAIVRRQQPNNNTDKKISDEWMNDESVFNTR